MPSLLVLNIEGYPVVQAVRLDDPSPHYAAEYAETVAGYIDPAAALRWTVVDVVSVAEYGPNQVAAMLAGDEDWTLDVPQEWETIGPREVRQVDVPKPGWTPLHERLRDLRQRAGLSQPELFRRVADVSFDTMRGAEAAPGNARHRYPSLRTLEAIAEVIPTAGEELPELDLARARELFDERAIGLEAAVANLDACPDVRRLLDPRRGGLLVDELEAGR